jgi:Lon protease-like protein
MKEAGWVANRWADLLPLPADEKAALLAESDCVRRLERISDWLPDDFEDAGPGAS